MRIAILALLIGCTPAAQTITPAHPAHPDAEPGRLAGPPAALRPGVVEEATPPPAQDEHAGHAGHEMPADQKPADSKQLPGAPKPPTPGPPGELKPPTSGVPADSKPPTDAKPPAKKPPAKKPPAKPPAKPADDPHERHTTPNAEPPKPADDPHKGHHGH